MMITPTEVRVTEDRRHDLIAATARARLITAATHPSPSTTPRPVARLHASLRQAVAALVALASIA